MTAVKGYALSQQVSITLTDTQLQEGESVEVHIRVMKELTDRLAMMGWPKSQEDRCHVLLLSLPSSYENLVTTLPSPEILVYQTIVNGIIEFEMKTGGHRRNDLALVGSAGNRGYTHHGNHANKHFAPKHVTAVTSPVTSLDTVPRPNRVTIISHSRNPIILQLVRGTIIHDRLTIGIRPRWRVRCLMRNSSSVPRET